MIYDFLTPIDKENFMEGQELHPGQIGNYITIFDGKEPEIGWYDIAIIGIEEDRASVGNAGTGKAPTTYAGSFTSFFCHRLKRNFI